MANDHATDRIKATVTVADVLSRSGVAPMRRAADGSVGACPICSTGKNKRSRAFTASANGRAWYCFGDCRRGGSVIDLVMAMRQCDLKRAIAWLDDGSV